MTNKIRLADFLTKAVEEVIEAHRRALERGVPFLGFEELEVECAVDTEIGAKGEASFFYVKIGASGKQTVGNKIKVVYKPYDAQRHTLQAAVLKELQKVDQGPVPSSQRAVKSGRTKLNR
jgi:hypothetical protein